MMNKLGAALLSLMVCLSLIALELEAKPLANWAKRLASDPPDVSVDCSESYQPFCTCQAMKTKTSIVDLSLTCKVATSQDFEDLKNKLSEEPNYFSVSFVMSATLDIPEDVMGGTKTRFLQLSCSDRSTPLGPVHADAFGSTLDCTEKLEIKDCGLTETPLAFLSKFSVLTDLVVTTSNTKAMIDIPHLAQLKSITFSNIANLDSWYSPTQTPDLEEISVINTPDLDDQKLDSIMSSMTKDFSYPKLTTLRVSHNSLTRFSPLFSIFPSLTTLDLRGNPITTLAEGSINKGSTALQVLYLATTQLTTIEPGAFVGDFSSTGIYLSNNPMTSFPSSVFLPLLKSMVNHKGYVSIAQNPIVFDCSLAWLLVENQDLLSLVWNGAIDDGTRFEKLDTSKLTDCS